VTMSDSRPLTSKRHEISQAQEPVSSDALYI